MSAQYEINGNKKLKISAGALQLMKSFVQQESRSTEAGGVLVGRVLLEDGNYIIDEASPPMPTDERRRSHFYRHPEGHQQFFDAIWERSDHRCYYLGEWHTHPEEIPIPSSVDMKTWRRILSTPPQQNLELFFIIMGTSQMRIWHGINTQGKIIIRNVPSSPIQH